MTDSNWEQLMIAAQRGDTASYRHLMGLLNLWLTRYFSHRLPPSMIEGAVEDTLIAIHHKRNTFDPRLTFGGWLSVIAHYKWISGIRAMKILGNDGHQLVGVNAPLLEALAAELKPAQGQVIRMVTLEGLSIQEAAARSGQSVAQVRTNLHRGLARMAALAAHAQPSEPVGD